MASGGVTVSDPVRVGAKAPAHSPSELFPIVLNDRWRVVDAPPHWHPQWILQRKEARARARSDGWVGNAYCTTRTALARNISERCGDVDPAAMAVIEALPERHPRVSGRQQKGSI